MSFAVWNGLNRFATLCEDATMVIRFTSTLTDEDEARLAPALLKALGTLLAPFPISYSIRIETTAGDTIEDGRATPKNDVPLTRRTLFGPAR